MFNVILLWVFFYADLNNVKGKKFSMKEGVQYRLRINFFVQREIVSGLKYIQKVQRMNMTSEYLRQLHCFVVFKNEFFSEMSIVNLNGRLIDCSNGQLFYWLIDWLIEWLIDWLIGLFIMGLSLSPCVIMYKNLFFSFAVDKTTHMVGSYPPALQMHSFTTPLEEAPSGMMARASYNIKSLFTVH